MERGRRPLADASHDHTSLPRPRLHSGRADQSQQLRYDRGVYADVRAALCAPSPIADATTAPAVNRRVKLLAASGTAASLTATDASAVHQDCELSFQSSYSSSNWVIRPL